MARSITSPATPSRGNAGVAADTATLLVVDAPARATPREELTRAREVEAEGRSEEGRRAGDFPTVAEALRRLGILLYKRGDPHLGSEMCRESLRAAIQAREPRLAAEALNTHAVIELESGAFAEAKTLLEDAVALAGDWPELRARVEQNLGIIANVQGDWVSARAHYARSLEAYGAAGDHRGAAIAYHNLGMIDTDQRRWADAEAHFDRSLAIALKVGDAHLEGLCRLNQGEVLHALERFDSAYESVDGALRIFTRLGCEPDKAGAYKLLGMIYRDTNRLSLAEARLASSVQLFQACESPLGQAEASRELALLYGKSGQSRQALSLLTEAHRLFLRLDARADLVDIGAKLQQLEETYLKVVRNWGESIESSDSYTFGHCQRVAEFGVALARELGLDGVQLMTIRVGAYLHDLGKVKVPHEVLNKPGRLTDEEFAIIKRHPVWGEEMLADVELPWDVKPIIRWHHEKYDGSGYPDRLKGEEIPLSAQIICMVDVFDALTTNRSYRGAMTPEVALGKMRETAHWWRPDLFEAFLRVVATLASSMDQAA